MLRLLGPKLPSRTRRPSLNDIQLDHGRSRIIFNANLTCEPSDGSTQSLYLVTNYLPPAPQPPSDPELPNSSLCPPYHIHLEEDETFHVISGEAKFLYIHHHPSIQSSDQSVSTQDGITRHIVHSSEKLTIPRGQIHTFRNASSTRPLILEFGFSPPATTHHHDAPTSTPTCDLNHKMRRFFLNTQLYRSDCAAQDAPRSLSQILLFNHGADVALVPPWLLALYKRHPRLRRVLANRVAPVLGRVMNLVVGVVLGRFLFGLRESYDEYCNHCGLTGSTGAQSVRSSLSRRRVGERDHGFDGRDDAWPK